MHLILRSEHVLSHWQVPSRYQLQTTWFIVSNGSTTIEIIMVHIQPPYSIQPLAAGILFKQTPKQMEN